MPGILTLMQDIFHDSRGMWLLSHAQGYAPTGLESSTPQHQLHLPEVCAPAQYFIDAGLGPALARQLSSTYMDSVDRYRKACQTHFDRATRGGHLTEHYREVFTVLFKRTTQAWGSQIVSIVRVRLCQAGAPQATVRPERVDIRVGDAAKAEIIARVEPKVARLTSVRMVTSPSAAVASRVEEVSEYTRTLSTDMADSRLMSSELSPNSSTEVTFRPLDPFSYPAPSTCFPAPYPPPPDHSSSCSSQRALVTSFVPPAPPRNVRPLASCSPDVSSLTDLFGRMTVTTLTTESTNPKCHRMFGISEINKYNPVPPPITPNYSKEPLLASIESIASLPKSTTTTRRRKIAALPTRRAKASASPLPPVFDLAGATSYFIPRPSERVIEGTTPVHIPTSPQKTHASTLSSLYPAKASWLATPKPLNTQQRKMHTPHHKAYPQSQTIPQNPALTPLVTDGRTFSYFVSRSPPLVSDTTSYFDSPPTSSDELDTPPSTPPSSHVRLAHTSTESLAISSESARIVSHKEPLRDAKLPNPRRRYRRLDFTKGGLVRDEQPLTFTFSV